MDFGEYHFNVTAIAIACYVAPGTGAPSHPNRPHHGLVLTLGGRTVYAFADGQCITAEEMAGWAGTICYEVLLSISDRVPRVYLPARLKKR